MAWKKWVNKKKKWENSPEKLCILFSPINRKTFFGKTSFCTLKNKMKKASLAVETAMILPIFFLAVVAMISMMDIYRVQTEHLTKLCEKAKEAGMYAYGMTDTEELTLPDLYSYKPVSGIIPLPKITIYNTVTVHAWTGTGEHFSSESATEEKMVYVTESGEAYHRSLNCSYLNVSFTQISGTAVSMARNDYNEKYSACEICSKNQKPAGQVYLTKKGNRYHNSENCSGLKRTVKMIKESQASGKYRACGRCG